MKKLLQVGVTLSLVLFFGCSFDSQLLKTVDPKAGVESHSLSVRSGVYTMVGVFSGQPVNSDRPNEFRNISAVMHVGSGESLDSDRPFFLNLCSLELYISLGATLHFATAQDVSGVPMIQGTVTSEFAIHDPLVLNAGYREKGRAQAIDHDQDGTPGLRFDVEEKRRFHAGLQFTFDFSSLTARTSDRGPIGASGDYYTTEVTPQGRVYVPAIGSMGTGKPEFLATVPGLQRFHGVRFMRSSDEPLTEEQIAALSLSSTKSELTRVLCERHANPGRISMLNRRFDETAIPIKKPTVREIFGKDKDP